MSFNKKFFTTGGIVASTPAAADATDYFNTVLYTGDGGTQTVTGVGFQADLIWVKNRDDVVGHRIYDVTRGLNTQGNGTEEYLDSSTANQSLVAGSGGLLDHNSDGFRVGSGNAHNGLNDDIVAWCWKGNGQPSSNSNGSITSSVSANTANGFSIVGYTKSGSSGTIGHGLSSAPELIIEKRDGTQYWNVRAEGITANNQTLYLNQPTQVSTHPTLTLWSTPTSSVFGYNSGLATAGDYVAYCFHSVTDVQKVGTYAGGSTGSSNEITTGFSPRFILTKSSNADESWSIFDSQRNGTGTGGDGILFANTSDAENTATDRIEFTSTGFYWETTQAGNVSGRNYIYLAIA